jgi:hypothetical protein
LTAVRVITNLKHFCVQNFVVFFGVEKRFSERQNVRRFSFRLLSRVKRLDLEALVDLLVNANYASKSCQDESDFSNQAGQSVHLILSQLGLAVEKVRFNVFKAVEVVFANLNIVLKQGPPRFFNETCQQSQHVLQ